MVDSSEIWSLSATEIAARVRKGEVSARAVVDAHVRRIEAVNPSLNALVVPRFAEARRHADEADAASARGVPLGPLHGVPFTVKECFHVAGTHATAGVDALGTEVSAEDGPLVAALREAGGILLGKTNLPQLIMGCEADNPIFGRTRNPWDTERSPGGSSGGEAAIVAAMGSPLGLGTDLGGSVRTPAHFCGIGGLKPTRGRLTMRGTVDDLVFGRFDGIAAQPGPMARSVADLELALGVLARASSPECPGIPELGASSSVRLDGLRIGYYEDDGHFTPAPALRRAVRDAVRALERAGCVVTRFVPPDVTHAMAIYAALICSDGGKHWRELLGASRRTANVTGFVESMRVPVAVKSRVARLAQRAGQHRLADALATALPRTSGEYEAAHAARAAYEARFTDALDASRLDAIVCPPFGLPALRHRTDTYVAHAMSYAAIWNLLGLPAGVVATTRVRTGEESDRGLGLDAMDLVARGIEHGSAGLPVGVQVAARAYREDVVLAVMAHLEADARAAPPAGRARPL